MDIVIEWILKSFYILLIGGCVTAMVVAIIDLICWFKDLSTFEEGEDEDADNGGI